MRSSERVDQPRPRKLRRAGSLGLSSLILGPAFAGVVGMLMVTRGGGAAAALYLAVPVVTILHEAAHALVGAAVGRRPRVMHLFGGKRWFTVKVGSTLIVVGRNLFGGGAMVSMPAPQPSWRSRDALMVLAGPASGMVVALIVVAAGVGRSGVVSAWLWGLAGAGAWTGLASLLPFKSLSVTGAQVASDGLLLVRLVRSDRASPRHIESTEMAVEVHAHLIRGDAATAATTAGNAADTCGDPAMKRIAAVAAVGAARFDDARRFAIDALDAVTSWSETELAELHNVVAWADLLLGDDALLDEAERHARLALDVTPSAATCDTWGWIELRRGRAVEAHGWFTEAFRATHSGQRDIRAIVALGLSGATRALGDYQLADAWKRTAQRNGGVSTVLVPPFARPVAAPPGPWTRTRLDRLAIVGNTAGEGTRWWLSLTLALCLVPLPVVDLAAHHYGPFAVWSIIVTALLITAERSRRAVRVTTVG